MPGPQTTIDVAFLPSQLRPESLTGRTVVVVDVLRATTTIATAISHGCRRVLPQPSIEAALAAHAQMEANPETVGESLIGGERGGQIVAGFHCGNSPLEYTPESIGDRTLILATTNGTVAMEHCRHADRILVGAMVNLTAVANTIRQTPHVTVLCSGTDRHVTGEDVLFAGALVDRLAELRGQAGLEVGQSTDAAAIARAHWDAAVRQTGRQPAALAKHFQNCRGGINLARLGHHRDIEFAAQIDAVPIVAELDIGAWEIRATAEVGPARG